MSQSISKILPLAELAAERARLKEAGKVVVLTNGHFELLHPGHIRYLQQARALGDRLIVALNDDESTRRLKGRGRPVVDQTDRAEVLAALACVDYVVIFQGATAEDVVVALKPDVYVKGGDYSTEGGKTLPEATVVTAAGGRVEIVPFADGYSTTALIDKIAARHAHPLP